MNSYMLCLIQDGEGVYNFNNESYYLKKNTICFIPPWTLISWQSQTSWQNGFCCTFSEAFFNQGQENKQWLEELALPGSNVLALTEQQTQYFAVLLQDMFDESGQKSNGDPETVRTQLQLIVRKIAGLIPNRQNLVAPKSRAALVLTTSFMKHCREDFEQLIKGDIDSRPSLANYAGRLFVTPNHLNDTLKEVIGQSVGQYLDRELTAHANSLLHQTEWSIHQIAARLGFKDASYFSRFYKKHTNITPTAFREKSVDRPIYSV